MSCRRLAGAVLALVVSGPASAAEPVAVVTGPGDQTAPSLSSTRLAYVDDASGVRQVWVRDLSTGEGVQVSAGAVDHGDPDLDGNRVAFTTPGGLDLVALGAGGTATIPASGAAHATLSALMVAWDQPGTAGHDVAFLPLGAASPQLVPASGDEHGPALAYGWLAWIDEAGAGSIELRAPSGVVSTVYAGRAEKVAIWAASRLDPPLLAAAVTVASGGQDLVVLGADGTERARLTLPGLQRNPTLSGEWVGFEDLATGVAQVGLWQWSAGRVVYPSPSSSEQRLNDVAADPATLRVAWADGRSGTLDVFLFEATLPLPDVPVGEARCDDPLAQVLLDFAVTVVTPGPASGGVVVPLAQASPVLVCVDGLGVDAGQVEVDDATILLPPLPDDGTGGGSDVGCQDDDHHHGRPHDGHHQHHDGHHRHHGGRHRDDARGCGHDGDGGGRRHHHDHRGPDCDEDGEEDGEAEGGDEGPAARHVEARLAVPAGDLTATALVEGDAGATVRVRVLADGWTTPVRSGCLPGVDCPIGSAAVGPGAPGSQGCATGGGAGLLALLAAALGLRRCGRARRP